MAGGGIKGGIVHGATDEIGFHAVEDRHYVTDIHATILHQLGLDPRNWKSPAASAWRSTTASRSARSWRRRLELRPNPVLFCAELDNASSLRRPFSFSRPSVRLKSAAAR